MRKIGFIGQGFIGKNYADNFEKRGYKVARYSKNKYRDDLSECEVVFIAVPTPTKNGKFDGSILMDAMDLTYPEQIVVIKSTVTVGTTDRLQEVYKDRYLFHSPEFLTEKTAKHDTDNPERNILGYTEKSKNQVGIIDILPKSEYNSIIPAREAEFVKYMGNCIFYFKLMAMNSFYDIAKNENLDMSVLTNVLVADKRVGESYTQVEHNGGRGAGGHCFPKDFEALIEMYSKTGITLGENMLNAMRDYNKSICTK